MSMRYLVLPEPYAEPIPLWAIRRTMRTTYTLDEILGYDLDDKDQEAEFLERVIESFPKLYLCIKIDEFKEWIIRGVGRCKRQA